MFLTNSEDIDYIFESLGKEVLINGNATNAVITNPSISEYEQRYIHTLQNVSRGDMVTIQGEVYLVISESVTKRHGKFKSLIRHCNFILEVPGEITRQPYLDENGNQVYDDYGEPIFIDIQEDPIPIPAIIDNQSFSVDESTSIRMPENQIIVTVQDNEVNRQRFSLNDEFTFEGNYSVAHRDFTKKGLIILTCEWFIA